MTKHASVVVLVLVTLAFVGLPACSREKAGSAEKLPAPSATYAQPGPLPKASAASASATPSAAAQESAPSSSAPSAPVPARPTVTRRGTISGFGDTTIKLPDANVERSKQIVAADGGALDLARSKDGQDLWSARYWDDGSVDINHFHLNLNGFKGLVLQFVDGVTEPLDFEGDRWPLGVDESNRWPLGVDAYRDSHGNKREHILDAWPVDLAKMKAFNLTTHTWIPLLPARAGGTSKASALQWMVLAPACSEIKEACVYFGAAPDVCARFVDATPQSEDQNLWIWPRKCGSHG